MKRLFLATRPMFFPASVVPVAVGTAWGYHISHTLDQTAFVLTLIGMMALHAGSNVINDVGDELNGADRANGPERIAPFTGGSRMIQDGILDCRTMAIWGAVLLGIAALCGLMLTWAKGWPVLALGLVGGGLALAYSLKPFSLVSRGLGEIAIVFGFGLPVIGAGFVQAGTISPELIWAAVANGCFSAAILIANEIPDRVPDEAVGKRTLVVRLGAGNTRYLYGAVQAFGVFAGTHCAHSLLGWLLGGPLLAYGFLAAKRLTGGREDQTLAIKLTLMIHLLGGLWLTVLNLGLG